ncbi:MAG: ribbon-helix-helix domain-containing protein, partial [Actinomycetota bacterium]|nr:ribbon-helix-helix domain-containing protein [Actinomycetota bacterium]
YHSMTNRSECDMIAKFTISMPEELLAEIDAEAQASGATRSGIIREASTRYVAERRASDAEAAHRARVAEAVEGMKRIARREKRDTRSTLELLRDLREHDGFADSDS